ncbi:unnamed protein product [Ceutorhynchus assimilis]|uniref:Zinc finger PHD-type domain-containing protein n=1 Tax=Ceutorhynchus assimilis TaxID=467358 RepID=A0A9N9MF09_9CUCU|nr:unnamed protein product [Ceutorhynchus assimilis]
MEASKNNRGYAKGKITRTEKYLNGFIDLNFDINELNIREDLLINSFNEFCAIQQSIEEQMDAMPTQYKRKLGGKPRRQWRQEDLEEALRCLTSGKMGVNEASRAYGNFSRSNSFNVLKKKRKKQAAQLLNQKILKQSKNQKSLDETEISENSENSDDEPLAKVAKKIKTTDKTSSEYLKKLTITKKSRRESKSERCAECLENYYETTETVDWLECIACKKWYHETCSLYANKCNLCGREEKRAEKAKKDLKKLF